MLTLDHLNALDDASLNDVKPIAGGVPIKHIPHATLLLNLAEEHGFREGFCMWAEGILAVYDYTASDRHAHHTDDLVRRARELRDVDAQEADDRYQDFGTKPHEFAQGDTPLRATLRELISTLGLQGAAARLKWEPRTLIGWALGPRAAVNWLGWMTAERLIGTGCPNTVAANLCGVTPAQVRELDLPNHKVFRASTTS